MIGKKLVSRAGLVPVAVAFATMAAMSWRRWGDILIDFGFQAYMPWQITQGRLLYRDGDWAFGPLSQYYHAALFELFGVSLTTLIVASLGLAGLLCVLLYEVFMQASDPVGATAACLVFVLAFAFAHYVPNGNYNYIFPYTYEVVHGLVLSVVAIGLLGRWSRKRSPALSAAGGFCVGLVFLTKPELFLASAAASVSAFALAARARSERAFVSRSLAWFACGGVVPIAVSCVALALRMGLREGVQATFMGWVTLLTTKAAVSSFYAWGMGLDAPGKNLLLAVVHAAVVAAFAVGAFLFCRWNAQLGLLRKLLACLFPAGCVGLAFGLNWSEYGRAFPILLPILCGHLAWRLLRGSQREQEADANRRALIWAVFSLVLLAKMGLNSRIWHYGFVLGMPAALSVAHYLGWFLPHALRGRGVHVPLFRATFYAVIAVALFKLVGLSADNYQAKTYPVGKGGDRIFTFEPSVDPRGLATRAALGWLARNAPPGASLAALPEGIMLNYLARRPNPTRHHSVVMMAALTFDEAPVLRAFQATPPDFILLVHRDAHEFGEPFYGQARGYGQQMMSWVTQNYEPVQLIGNEPMREADSFGIKIFRTKRGLGQR